MSGLARTLLERLSRGRSFVRHLPNEFQGRPIVVSPDAALRWLKPGAAAFDPELVNAARHLVHPGDVVWDFGANVGAFALLAAVRSGRPVLCVEADPFLAELLRRTAALERNRDLELEVVCAAVGDRDGIAEFAIAGRGRASSGLVRGSLSTQHGKTRQLLLTPIVSADSLLDGRAPPAMVKVDIEGGEGLFIDGAARLIDEVRPRFLIEVSAEQRDKVVSRFVAAGYGLGKLTKIGLELLGEGEMPGSIVALPAEAGTA